jgi:hypothetical protein
VTLLGAGERQPRPPSLAALSCASVDRRLCEPTLECRTRQDRPSCLRFGGDHQFSPRIAANIGAGRLGKYSKSKPSESVVTTNPILFGREWRRVVPRVRSSFVLDELGDGEVVPVGVAEPRDAVSARRRPDPG